MPRCAQCTSYIKCEFPLRRVLRPATRFVLRDPCDASSLNVNKVPLNIITKPCARARLVGGARVPASGAQISSLPGHDS